MRYRLRCGARCFGPCAIRGAVQLFVEIGVFREAPAGLGGEAQSLPGVIETPLIHEDQHEVSPRLHQGGIKLDRRADQRLAFGRSCGSVCIAESRRAALLVRRVFWEAPIHDLCVPEMAELFADVDRFETTCVTHYCECVAILP